MKIGIGPFYLFIFIEIGSNYVDQADFELTEVCQPMPSKCWDLKHFNSFNFINFYLVNG